MAELQLSKLPPDVIRTKLCKTIEKILNSNNYKIAINSASKEGENNFAGEIYRVSFGQGLSEA